MIKMLTVTALLSGVIGMLGTFTQLFENKEPVAQQTYHAEKEVYAEIVSYD